MKSDIMQNAADTLSSQQPAAKPTDMLMLYGRPSLSQLTQISE